MSDINELKDTDLEKVSGGFTANADGTYSFKAGDTFRESFASTSNLFEVMYDYENVTPDTEIECWQFVVDENLNA